MAPRKFLVVIAGPTAVGKTYTAIKVAQHFNTAIISADSRQCYREMSVGTAKPSFKELSAVPHYFINSHSITEALNAADYERLALGYCDEIFSRHNIAVVCGGTGLYIKALCEGMDVMPPSDKGIEASLRQQLDEKGIAWLQQTTREEDPEFYAVAEQQNPARLIRALAFFRSNGRSIVHYRNASVKERPFHIIKIGLELPRTILYERINRRVDVMMAEGLPDEITRLYPYRHLKNLHTVGYSEFWDADPFPPGKQQLAEIAGLIKQHTRNYAKRQLTWFRKDKEFKWFQPSETDIIIRYINHQLQ